MKSHLIAYCGERGIEVVPEIDLKIMQEVVGEFLDEIKTPPFHMGAGEVHVELGAARLPFAPLSDEQTRALRSDLDKLGFFEWLA